LDETTVKPTLTQLLRRILKERMAKSGEMWKKGHKGKKKFIKRGGFGKGRCSGRRGDFVSRKGVGKGKKCKEGLKKGGGGGGAV